MYRINYRAIDSLGASCAGSTVVKVRHSMKKGDFARTAHRPNIRPFEPVALKAGLGRPSEAAWKPIA